MRVRMLVSIAGGTAGKIFSFQPGEVVDLEDSPQTRAWIQHGHAEKVSQSTPLTDRDLNLRDLDADEALTRRCFACDRRRARFVLRNQAYCPQCFRAALEG